MILIRLMGGLGNQMFQYAFAYSLALKNKTEIKVDTTLLDDRSKPHEMVTHRDLVLNKVFDIEVNFATQKEIEKFNGKLYSSLFGKIYNKILWQFKKHHLVIEKDRGFHGEYLNLPNNRCLVGAFQSEKYFTVYQNEIRKLYKFRNDILPVSKELLQSIKTSNSVAIHVRRGDYVTSPLYSKTIGALPTEYYLKSIDYMLENISAPQFYVFSDDIQWCKETFANSKIKPNYLEDEHAGDNAANYLQLMTTCKHFIISNSTYSWWAAWLSNHINKIVVAPEKWFADNSRNSKDIIPVNWIKL